PLHFDDFKINDSTSEGNLNLPLTPDFAICESCKKEILDPNSRRYKYAFTTCVSCGPRYAITHTFPFERKNTTLANFEMCQKCQEEYSQASERRFHSQTNSCKTCGIRLSLKDGDNQIVSEDQNEIIAVVAQLILKGNIIAIKNTSGYLLCCDATNPQVLKKLRKRKN
ncbi:MAG: Sua5/YciO/YrdC/YwlC family protein, partial [Flavobacteriaceae bacterium]